MRRAVILVLLVLCCLSPAGGRAAEPPVEQMIGQMILTGFRGTAPEHPEVRRMLERIAAGRVGGVILFDYDAVSKSYGRNITNPEQLKNLTAVLAAAVPGTSLPLFIAVDQEGGRVQRLRARNGFTDWPSHQQLGKETPEAAFDTALRMGEELRNMGINVDFAPCVDVDRAESQGIGSLERAFSHDMNMVTAHARMFMAGLTQSGVVSSLKHFPGHGSARADSHKSLPDITGSFRPDELEPYAEASPEHTMIMVGHLLHKGIDPNMPASLSRPVINGLLRDKLGWNGVVITDDLQMAALTSQHSLEEIIRNAVTAGVDILLFGNNIDYDPNLPDKVFAILLDMHRNGDLPVERLLESHSRIARLKQFIR